MSSQYRKDRSMYRGIAGKPTTKVGQHKLEPKEISESESGDESKTKKLIILKKKIAIENKRAKTSKADFSKRIKVKEQAKEKLDLEIQSSSQKKKKGIKKEKLTKFLNKLQNENSSPQKSDKKVSKKTLSEKHIKFDPFGERKLV